MEGIACPLERSAGEWGCGYEEQRNFFPVFWPLNISLVFAQSCIILTALWCPIGHVFPDSGLGEHWYTQGELSLIAELSWRKQ